MSKDDIFSNFILAARKYKSFLSSPDKDKKEIINRFSNGVIVDEAITALNGDIEPVQALLLEAEKNVAECRGRVTALASEIERAIEESANRSANKKARIESWKEAIANKRAGIRKANEQINEANDKLDAIDLLDEQMQAVEKNAVDTQLAYEGIKEHMAEVGLVFAYDYESEHARLQSQLREAIEQDKHSEIQYKKAQADVEEAVKSLSELEATYSSDMQAIAESQQSVKDKIDEIARLARELQATQEKVNSKRLRIIADIAALEKQLAGVIQCPKCNHEFTLAADIDINTVRQKLAEAQREEDAVGIEISSNQKAFQKYEVECRREREKQLDLERRRIALGDFYKEAKQKVRRVKNILEGMENALEFSKEKITSIKRNIGAQRKKMFDAAFDMLDEAYKKHELQIKNLELEISNCNGAIKSYQESIAEVENSNDNDIINSLKESKVKNEALLAEAVQKQESINRQLAELKLQEATFIEFKTHLANAKINAVSRMTNDFLEAIGSDIRVNLSGYTILKSGKVRDKISVSLLRDGVDCGSFDKFSKGEQTRVELASILALHKLTNVNCEEGKGLNLLIFDEILDATDEQGLTNVFKALNDTHITSLVVSHGKVAENYPSKLIVNKRNGISYL